MTLAPQSPKWSPARLLIIAAAGYGKTTALETEVGDGATYHRAVELAPLLGDADPFRAATEDPPDHVRIDDLCQLSAAAQHRLMQALGALPPDIRISLAARGPLHPVARACLRGEVFERGATDLALTAAAVAGVLRDEHGVDDATLARQAYDLTAGWPALVHFAGDALARGADELLAALAEPGTAAASWILAEVLADLPPDVAHALDLVVDLDPLSADLFDCVAGTDGQSRDAFTWLRRTGLVVPHPLQRRGPGSEPARLVPVIAAVLGSQRTRKSTGGGDVGDRLPAAATWYERNGYPLAAAKVLARVGRPAESAALIELRGEEMLAAGEAADIVALLQADTGTQLRPPLQRVLADSLRMSGDAPAALRAFAPLVDNARHCGWDSGLAWRLAMVHYMLGCYPTALEVLDKVLIDERSTSRDEIELQACRANVLAMLGAEEEAARIADAAVSRAEATGNDRAVAAAHLAAANTSTGARKEGHLAQALAAAERAGDVVQTARVLANQTYGLLAAARYLDAYEVGAKAVAAAERGSPPGLLVVALHNAGDALTRVGHYDEAAQHFKHSIALCRRLGLQRVAWGLWGLAEIHRQLGRREQSRATFEEAVNMARASAEIQVLVPALAGLARVLLEQSADTSGARRAAEEAERLAPPEHASYALCARGWVAIAEGDAALARQRAEAAISAARASGMVDALADALELTAAAAGEPAVTQAALFEALAIWQASGAEPAADRIRVLLGRLPGADGSARSTARDAEKRLVRLGIRAVHESPLPTAEGAVTVDVRVMGGFEVQVGARVVPLPAWRSRQARTLVKILASRRGRRVTRSELCELLWPDDEATRTAHRLSVLLSVVRSVLDPDRAWPADHYIAADLAGLSMDLTHVSVDVEHLLDDASHATSLLRSGDRERAHEILTEVDARYRGDAFEDEPYEEWADGLREEARAAWLRSLRHLAELRADAGEHQDATSLLVRMLVADPYDEPAHRALVDVLVRAGRHGEARRAFDRWAGAMRSIAAPLPNPGVLRPRASAPASNSPAAIGRNSAAVASTLTRR
jgi:DNA-binding SARP family transcriptional activator/tetratricopeptide (TPR) repeat protein